MWFVPAPEMADPAARLRGGGLQARGGQRPTASRGASRPPWIDRAARASLLAALGRRLPAQAAWRKPERLCIAPRRQPVAAWLRGRARSASSVAAAWDARPSPRPLLARYLRQETGEGQDSLHPSQLGGQGARGGAGGAFISRRAACATRVYEAVRRGRMRWLGAHLELLSCRLTAAHHA